MSDKRICARISIELTLDPSNLVGDEYEYAPYIGSWCTVNPHRIVRLATLSPVSPLPSTAQGKTSSNAKTSYTRQATQQAINSYQHPLHEFSSTPLAAGEESVVSDEVCVPPQRIHYRTDGPISYEFSRPEYHAYDSLLPDTAIWLKLMTKSNTSGIPKIDENDRKFHRVVRTLQSGICQLELYDIFSHAVGQPNVNKQGISDVKFLSQASFVEPKLMNIKMAELYESMRHKTPGGVTKQAEQSIIDAAYAAACKSVAQVTVTVHGFNYKNYVVSPFGVKNFKTAYFDMKLPATLGNTYANLNTGPERGGKHKQSFNHILYNTQAGVAHLMASMNYAAQVYCEAYVPINGKQPLYQPMDKSIAQLHLPVYTSEQGPQPAHGYWTTSTPYTREYANELLHQQDLKEYGFGLSCETHLRLMIGSSLRRYGQSAGSFIRAVQEHYDPRNKALVCSDGFLLAVKVVADVGTFAGNTVYYKSDTRYMKLREDVQGVHFKDVSLDSFDNDVVNGTGSSDDCEGSEKVARAILDAMRFGRYDLNFEWATELTRAVKLLLDNHVIFDLGATVTSAYVDTNDQPINLREKELDLPVVGDRMDLASTCDGHCYGLMMSRAIAQRLLSNGNLDRQLLAQVCAAGAAVQTRDYTVPMMVLEGTGSIEPTLMAIDETYAQHECPRIQARACFSFMKGLKKQLSGETDEAVKDLMYMFSSEGMKYYAEKQARNRRISSFYRAVNPAICSSLYKHHGTLSQFAFCIRTPTGQYVYGVNMGDLLRAGRGEKTSVALVATYKDIEKEWESKIRPMTASIQNQQPIMAFGNYTEEELEKGVYSRYLGSSRVNQAEMEALLESVEGNRELAIVRLQSREWKLTDARKVEALNAYFDATPGVVAHCMFSEKHFPNCDALVDILLVIKTSLYK